MQPKLGYFWGIHWAVWFVIVVAVSLIFGSLFIALMFSDDERRIGHALVWMLSIPCGFLLGTLVSPLGRTEAVEFKGAGAALSALLSGFVLSKLDRLFEDAIEHQWLPTDAITTPALIFVSTTLTTLAVTAAIRRYALPEPAGRKASSPDPAVVDH